MKELLKVISKKLLLWSIVFNTIYSIADYGEAFALSYFGTSPLTLDYKLGVAYKEVFYTYDLFGDIK